LVVRRLMGDQGHVLGDRRIGSRLQEHQAGHVMPRLAVSQPTLVRSHRVVEDGMPYEAAKSKLWKAMIRTVNRSGYSRLSRVFDADGEPAVTSTRHVALSDHDLLKTTCGDLSRRDTPSYEGDTLPARDFRSSECAQLSLSTPPPPLPKSEFLGRAVGRYAPFRPLTQCNRIAGYPGTPASRKPRLRSGHTNVSPRA
jgi:hypothetical protein